MPAEFCRAARVDENSQLWLNDSYRILDNSQQILEPAVREFFHPQESEPPFMISANALQQRTELLASGLHLSNVPRTYSKSAHPYSAYA